MESGKFLELVGSDRFWFPSSFLYTLILLFAFLTTYSAEQFPIMGKALYAMLADKLGDAFTDDMRDSWKAVFGTIVNDLMLTVLKSSREERAKISDSAENSAATTAA